VFVATLDAHVIALDRKTGSVSGRTRRALEGLQLHAGSAGDQESRYRRVSGGETNPRFIDAYDAATGERKWRFNTIPVRRARHEPGKETRGSLAVRPRGSPDYDPETNTNFGQRNPSPRTGGEGPRATSFNCLLHSSGTGKLKWHFQFTPHDEHDYDATQFQ